MPLDPERVKRFATEREAVKAARSVPKSVKRTPAHHVGMSEGGEIAAEVLIGAGAGAIAGGPIGAAIGGAVPLADIAIFGTPGERGIRGEARAGMTGNVASTLLRGRSLPVRAGLGAAAVGAQQLAEGASPQEAFNQAILQGLVPEGVGDTLSGIAKAGESARRRIKNLISPNTKDLISDFREVLGSSDPRFKVAEIPDDGLAVLRFADDFRPKGPGGAKITALRVPVQDIRRFQDQVSANQLSAVIKNFGDEPTRFAALKSTLPSNQRAGLEAEWVQSRLLKGPRRIEPGDLTKALKGREDEVDTVLGARGIEALRNVEDAIQAVKPGVEVRGRARSFAQYVENRFIFDVGRSVIRAGAAGGDVAGGGLGRVVGGGLGIAIAVPTMIAAGAIAPQTTNLLRKAAKENNILAVQGLVRQLEQLGMQWVKTGPNEIEMLPPDADPKTAPMMRKLFSGPGPQARSLFQ